MYIFKDLSLFVYVEKTNEIKEITEEVQGELFDMEHGTSTVVKDKFINTGRKGT